MRAGRVSQREEANNAGISGQLQSDSVRTRHFTMFFRGLEILEVESERERVWKVADPDSLKVLLSLAELETGFAQTICL